MTETTASASTPECGAGDEWRAPDIDRPDGSLTAPEPEMLRGMLAWHRSTLLWKCSGLTAAQLAERSVPPSGLSLLGLIRHLRKVERIWLRTRFAGEPVEPLHGFGARAGAGLRRGRRRVGARGLRGTAHRMERGGSRRRRAKPRRGRRGGRRPVLVALRLPAPDRGVRQAQRPRRPRARGRRRRHGGLSHGSRQRHRRTSRGTTRGLPGSSDDSRSSRPSMPPCRSTRPCAVTLPWTRSWPDCSSRPDPVRLGRCSGSRRCTSSCCVTRSPPAAQWYPSVTGPDGTRAGRSLAGRAADRARAPRGGR